MHKAVQDGGPKQLEAAWAFPASYYQGEARAATVNTLKTPKVSREPASHWVCYLLVKFK